MQNTAHLLHKHCMTSLVPNEAAQWRGVFLVSGLSCKLTDTPEANNWHMRPMLQHTKFVYQLSEHDQKTGLLLMRVIMIHL